MSSTQLKVYLISDNKCGAPCDVITAIEKCNLRIRHLLSAALLAGESRGGDVLILGRCRNIVPSNI